MGKEALVVFRARRRSLVMTLSGVLLVLGIGVLAVAIARFGVSAQGSQSTAPVASKIGQSAPAGPWPSWPPRREDRAWGKPGVVHRPEVPDSEGYYTTSFTFFTKAWNWRVAAGAIRNPVSGLPIARKPLIFVERERRKTYKRTTRHIVVPAASGLLTIVSGNANGVTLKDPKGNVFVFHWPAERVSSG